MDRLKVVQVANGFMYFDALRNLQLVAISIFNTFHPNSSALRALITTAERHSKGAQQ